MWKNIDQRQKATLYELRSLTSFEKKIDLLIETAKWSGDGLKASVLKLG